MARILFGVAGEGFGHSSRSDLIARRIIQSGHDVMFAASGRSLSYLTPLFPGRVQEVYGLHFVLKDGQVQALPTLVDNILHYPQGHKTNRRLFSQKVKDFAPDLVISDFEPFSAWWAFRHRVPCVFIDNEHLLTMAKLDHIDNLRSRIKADIVTRGYHTGAKAYVIMNFFTAPLKRKRAVLANPVIRKQVMDLKPRRGTHITVYSNSSNLETKAQFLSVLRQFSSQPFYIYGFNVDEQHGNCILKKVSTEGFLSDLASGAGVVATAGMSLLSECLYLKKRMFLTPLKGQFEQLVNAFYAERLGVGVCAEDLEVPKLKQFLNTLDKDYSTDPRILWPDNETYFAILDKTLQNIGIDLGLSSRQ